MVGKYLKKIFFFESNKKLQKTIFSPKSYNDIKGSVKFPPFPKKAKYRKWKNHTLKSCHFFVCRRRRSIMVFKIFAPLLPSRYPSASSIARSAHWGSAFGVNINYVENYFENFFDVFKDILTINSLTSNAKDNLNTMFWKKLQDPFLVSNKN